MPKRPPGIADNRIASSWGYSVAGLVALALGAFGSLAAEAGPDAGTAGFATFMFALAAALFSIGFFLRLARKLESRLIDIEAAIKGVPSEVRADGSGAPAGPPGSELI